MRTSTTAFQNLLNSQTFKECHLFVFTLATTQVFYWTDADVDVTFNGTVYSSSGPSISGVVYKLVRGLQVDTMELSVLVDANDLLGGVSWNIAAMSGALDGTTVSIEYALLSDWGQPAEAINIFKGVVADVKKNEIDFTVSVLSDADKLNTNIPRLLFQPGCIRTLYDAGCTVNRSLYIQTGSVTAVTNRVSFQITGGNADGYFSLGAITFITGANAGVRRSVKTYSAGNWVTLSFPVAMDIAIGDVFTIYPGCDHTLGPGGCLKFANTPNYKGTPYIPMPESLV